MSVDASGFSCTSGVCALTDTIVNNFYYTQLSAAGDTTPPYTWILAAGALPAGLTLSPGGQISGSTTTTGVSTFTVSVTDSAGKTATQQFSINVTAAAAARPGGLREDQRPAQQRQRVDDRAGDRR